MAHRAALMRAQRNVWRTGGCLADVTIPVSSAVQPAQAVLPDVVAILRERGLVQEVTSEELQKVAAAQSLAVYCGFDPTADSLHLGNLLGIIVLSWFQRCGHQPVALLGGATGRVGDPSGRSTERPVLSEEIIEHNVSSKYRCGAAGPMQHVRYGALQPAVIYLDHIGPMRNGGAIR
jgi:hypothetical protein